MPPQIVLRHAERDIPLLSERTFICCHRLAAGTPLNAPAALLSALVTPSLQPSAGALLPSVQGSETLLVVSPADPDAGTAESALRPANGGKNLEYLAMICVDAAAAAVWITALPPQTSERVGTGAGGRLRLNSQMWTWARGIVPLTAGTKLLIMDEHEFELVVSHEPGRAPLRALPAEPAEPVPVSRAITETMLWLHATLARTSQGRLPVTPRTAAQLLASHVLYLSLVGSDIVLPVVHELFARRDLYTPLEFAAAKALAPFDEDRLYVLHSDALARAVSGRLSGPARILADEAQGAPLSQRMAAHESRVADLFASLRGAGAIERAVSNGTALWLTRRSAPSDSWTRSSTPIELTAGLTSSLSSGLLTAPHSRQSTASGLATAQPAGASWGLPSSIQLRPTQLQSSNPLVAYSFELVSQSPTLAAPSRPPLLTPPPNLPSTLPLTLQSTWSPPTAQSAGGPRNSSSPRWDSPLGHEAPPWGILSGVSVSRGGSVSAPPPAPAGSPASIVGASASVAPGALTSGTTVTSKSAGSVPATSAAAGTVPSSTQVVYVPVYYCEQPLKKA